MSQSLKTLYDQIVPRAKRWLRGRVRTIQSGVGGGLKIDIDRAGQYSTGRVEVPVQEALAQHLRSGTVFYDIGANVGFFSLIGAEVVGPTGTVYAFEPVRENVRCIERNVSLNGFDHVTVFETAVSDASGEEELILTEHGGGATLENAGITPPDAVGRRTVEVVPLDDWISRSQIAPPDVVKIDVEGAEMNVLRGMVESIQRHRPVFLYEIDGGDADEFEARCAEVGDFLRSLGYDLTRLPESYEESNWHVAHYLALPTSETETQ